MEEAEGKKEEEKFDFTAEGEAIGYISLDQARLLAMETARDAPGEYGRGFRGTAMAFDVTAADETEDYYQVTLSVRPQGNFGGRAGREQIFIEKEGRVAHRQVLALPGNRRPPFLLFAVGLGVLATAVVVAVVVLGGGSRGDNGASDAAAPLATEVAVIAAAPMDTPEPNGAPVPTQAQRATPLPTTALQSTELPASPSQPADSPLPVPTAVPAPSPTQVPTGAPIRNVSPTATPIPASVIQIRNPTTCQGRQDVLPYRDEVQAVIDVRIAAGTLPPEIPGIMSKLPNIQRGRPDLVCKVLSEAATLLVQTEPLPQVQVTVPTVVPTATPVMLPTATAAPVPTPAPTPTPIPLTVTVDPPQISLEVGSHVTLNVVALDPSGNRVSGLLEAWQVPEDVGTINEDGVFTAGTKAGVFVDSVQVSVVKEGGQGSAALTVTVGPGTLDRIEVQPSPAIVKKGERIKLTARMYDPYGNEILGSAFLWQAEAGITVDQTGGVTAGTLHGRFGITVSAQHRGSERSASLIVGVPPVWIPLPEMAFARKGHTATLLPDGRVFIAGGVSSGSTFPEIYDPATKTFTTAAPLAQSRIYHNATLLRDGKILLAGGCRASVAELYDPVNQSSAPIQDTPNPRVDFSARTLLTDGKVLISGGRNCSTKASIDSAIIYDPEQGNFRETTGRMIRPRSFHTGMLLSNGHVAISGGYNRTADGNVDCLSTVEIYDSVTGKFEPKGHTLQFGGCGNDSKAPAITLPSGQLLMRPHSLRYELYDPTSGGFIFGPFSRSRSDATVLGLIDGKVLIIGGRIDGVDYDQVDIFDPAKNTLVETEPMTRTRFEHTATLLKSGQILVTGGTETIGERTFTYLSSAELFFP